LYVGYKQKEISKILSKILKVKVSESQISKEIKKMQKICK
jgi:Holliday junction resolvasome RuvABC DNA-binding subunit